MTIQINLNGALDIGNGYVKGVIENVSGAREVIDMPSSAAVLTRPNLLPVPDVEAPSVFQNRTLEGADAPDFYNILDASFNTPLVPDTYRRVFGTRSLTADGAFEEFDTVGRASKAKQPLSKVLVLGIFAAKALRDYVKQHGQLPSEEIQVTARAALALPISEFLRYRESYAAEFIQSRKPHLVLIQNFETNVVVRISFIDVQVLAEGASAQYAIIAKGEPLMNTMLADVRARSTVAKTALEGITAHDVLAATNTIGLDVGTGTTQAVVFSNGKFNAEASQTFNKGYGTILLNTIKSMEDQGLETGFSTRLELAQFLQHAPSALKKAFYNRVKQFVEQETRFFVDEVIEKLGTVLRNVGAVTEVAYVYGGGSDPIKDVLYPALLAKVVEMNSTDAFPVLYLNAQYSRHLNREGLFIAVKTVEERTARGVGGARR
ncbi:MAG: hypothetical protein B5766_10310 [Candidatus Lumbricidophila eiseniae]|uniref:Actin-like protein N-terminal domain-containing protein n=1 Tax=Candidatus Lumbricidiphila eiseniae TaxID=1969409 RepID=A0A2A6FPQ5_9MICO|nr:MAG: hypothetical protein B5766_10310 [Candidatus Lumbricidophila eiseniae]